MTRSSDASSPSRAGLARLDALPEAEARHCFERCCGASRWVEAMLQARPFGSAQSLMARADEIWGQLSEPDYREAFAHHPEIGADLHELRQKFASTAELAQGEQAGTASASEATLVALRRGNQLYRERFGYSFIVCATGKSAAEMQAILERRLANSPDSEIVVAAAEQAKITRLRLEKIITP